jgi:CBS domain-containing protein
LAPFHYYGIWDESVNYKEIPWRNGRFDPNELTNKLATLARARHALQKWREKAQSRTLAFCASIRHAEYMAEQFQKNGVAAAAVYSGSEMGRGDALADLADGKLQVIFSVDLFSEGVDLPAIDTVLMLRPTESKILFLQQLGRGLRCFPGKDKLVVLDFIGNHHSFLHKPQALGQAGASYRDLAEFARKVESEQLALPAGCFINYDLSLIDFLKALDSQSAAQDFLALGDALAMAVLAARGFTTEDFARTHPMGALGRKYYLRVRDVMQPIGEIPHRQSSALLTEVIPEMAIGRMGAILLLSGGDKLSGIFTDSDLRRLIVQSKGHFDEKLSQPISNFMTSLPLTIDAQTLASDALRIFEEKRISRIVCIENQKVVGLLGWHNLLHHKVT